jgi:3-deoxy-D-manno-octulosonic-acid transferase
MAISKEDARRYAALFNHTHVTTMPNMKFDRLVQSKTSDNSENPLSKIILPDTPFIVFGSIRKKEEPAVAKMMKSILNEIPQSVFGVFPRHLNRIKHWETLLKRRSIPCRLRSSLKSKADPGSVILWDVFGELTTAYIEAKAAFVGGTLAPLGGQNFLEAIICGVSPVIGPHWDNFKWAGSEIIELGFVRQASNQRQVTEILIRDILEGYDRALFHKKALTYIQDRQGGSDRASNVICEYLKR